MQHARFFLIVFLVPFFFTFAQGVKQKIQLSKGDGSKTEIVILSEMNGEITFQFKVNGFYTENLTTEKGGFSKLTFEDDKSTTELGRPQLPVFRKTIELPYDANPSIEIVSGNIGACCTNDEYF